MQPKPQINIRSFSRVILTVGSDATAPAETANWIVQPTETRVIKSGSRAVKVDDGLRINLNRVNKLLRGKVDVGGVNTRPSEELETA